MLAGIARYRLLSVAERGRALYAGARLMTLRRRGDARLATATVEELLIQLGQTAHARESFWNPVIVATLNEDPARAAAAPFVEVLARAFFRSRADSQFVLPKVGLSDLYTDDARRVIEAAGGQVETSAQATGIAVRDDRVAGVVLRDGRELEADACIAAVPPRALTSLLPDTVRVHPPLETSPIVSTHLWFDRPVLQGDFLGLIGTTTQWAFNRTRLTGIPEPDGGQSVSAVISAGRDVVDWDVQRVADTVVGDLRALVPAARTAGLRRAVVVKEKQATMACTPDAERLRPASQSGLRGLVFAGDWIATGLPPTIESAVESGARAATLVAGGLQ
jgi:squalene-associated FAD-dependent desaturase